MSELETEMDKIWKWLDGKLEDILDQLVDKLGDDDYFRATEVLIDALMSNEMDDLEWAHRKIDAVLLPLIKEYECLLIVERAARALVNADFLFGWPPGGAEQEGLALVDALNALGKLQVRYKRYAKVLT